MRTVSSSVTAAACCCLWFAVRIQSFSVLRVSRTNPRLSFKCAKPFSANDFDDARYQALESALSKLGQVYETPSFFEKIDKLTDVGPSMIEGAGRGLFAKKNIKSGSIITFYPIHAIGVHFEDSAVWIAAPNEGESDYFNPDETRRDEYLQYLVGSRPIMGRNVEDLFGGDALFIDVDPTIDVRAGWKGHYVNDGAIVKKPGEDGILEYYRTSSIAKNCVHVPFGPCPILATVATCKIREGEELLTSYGGSYWLEALLPGAEVEVTEAIREESLAVAKDIYSYMQSAALTYQSEADRLASYFKPL